MKVIELDHATIALRKLTAAIRYAPLRPVHRKMLEAIWADFYGAY